MAGMEERFDDTFRTLVCPLATRYTFEVLRVRRLACFIVFSILEELLAIVSMFELAHPRAAMHR